MNALHTKIIDNGLKPEGYVAVLVNGMRSVRYTVFFL